MSEGYVKLHRQLLEWEWFADSATVHVLTYLMITANWKEAKWMGITIPPGGTVTSREKIAAHTGLSEKQVRLALDKLEKGRVIERDRAGKGQLVTLVNWAKYQCDDKEQGRERASNRADKGPTKGQQQGRKRAAIEEEQEITKKGIREEELPLTGITPAKPVNGYGDQAINELMAYLKNANGGMTDGTDQENRRFCQHLINKARKTKPDADPVEGIKVFIDRATKLEWHGPRCTNFPYLYRHMTELVNLIKNPQQSRSNGSESIADKTQGVLDILRAGRL